MQATNIADNPNNPPQTSAPPPTPSVAAVALDPVRLLRTYWLWLVAAFIGGIILGVAVFLTLNFTAKQFTSEVVFLAQPALSDDVTEQFGLGIAGEEGEIFMATQVFALESVDTLRDALREPRVQNTQWAQQFMQDGVFNEVEALDAIQDVVSAGVIPQTSYFRAAARTPSDEDSATIAGAIGEVYLRTYQRNANRQANELIANVERQIDSLRGEIGDLDIRISRLLSQADVQSLNVGQLPENLELARLQPLIVENRDQRSRLQDQLEEYVRFRDQAGPPVYPEGIREAAIASPVAQQLESNIATQRARYNGLLASLGENHPETQRALALLRSFQEERDATVEEKMAEGFASTIEAYQNQISALDATHQDMITKREELTAALVDKNNIIKEADEATRERQLKAARLQQRQDDRAELEIIANRGGRVSIFSPARIPDRPSFPPRLPTVLVVTILITGAVGGIIVLKELREQRVRSPRDISLIPATRVLGVFPQLKLDPTDPENAETATRDRPLGAIAESARELRNSILKASHARGHKSVVFTSGLPQSGCSAVVTNLAHASANVEMRVLVIDANLRRPSLHEYFGLPNDKGLADILNNAAPPESAAKQAAPNLDLITAGQNPGHAYERFNTNRMTELLDWAKGSYDLVLLDSPPTVIASDALSLAARTDASALVVRAYSEKRGLVMRIRNMLGDARADFLGVVVNAVRLTAGGYFKQNLRASVAYHAEGPQPVNAEGDHTDQPAAKPQTASKAD